MKQPPKVIGHQFKTFYEYCALRPPHCAEREVMDMMLYDHNLFKDKIVSGYQQCTLQGKKRNQNTVKA